VRLEQVEREGLAQPVPEDGPVRSRRPRQGGQGLGEPGVPARVIIRRDVDDELDPVRLQSGGYLVEVVQRRRVERAEPDRVDPERGQVRDPGDDAPQVDAR